MTKLIRIAIVLGIGAAVLPFKAISQSPAEPATAIQHLPAAISVEDQATKEQVERLFQVMRVREQIESSLETMSTLMGQQLGETLKKENDETTEGKKLTPEQIAYRQQILSKFMEQALHMYSVHEMLGALTPVYQRHISRSDIEATIAFYGSSAGQHLLDQQPLIMKEYTTELSKTMQEKIAALTDSFKKELEEESAKENPNKPATE